MEAGKTITLKLRLALLPLGAVLLGALLTLSWINVLAARSSAPAAQAASYDFTVSKDAIPPSFLPGGQYLYQFAIAASGYTAGAATTIYIDDPLPPGVTWIPVNTSAWECRSLSTDTRATCFYSNTNTTTFVPLRIAVLLNRTPPGAVANEITNTVTIYTIPEDRDLTNNTDTLTTVTTENAVDLSIRKSVSPTVIDTGEITYTLSFSNTQATPATGVWISDTIPSDFTFVRANPLPDAVAGNTIRWNIPGSLQPSNGIQTISLTVNVPSSATGKLLTNAASIASIEPDRNTRNNRATVSIQPGTLSISKAVSVAAGDTVQVGEVFEYTITVRNQTAAVFRSIIISDTLQPGLDFVSGSFGTVYNSTTGAVTYSANSFPANATTTLRLQVRPSPSVIVRDTITNTARVSWVANDIRTTRESNEVEIVAVPAGTLDVDVTDGLTEIVAGNAVSYTIGISNTGNLPVNNVQIRSELSPYLTAQSIQLNNLGTGSCPRTDLCVLNLTNSLAAGQKITFRVGAKVDIGAPGGFNVSNLVIARGNYTFQGNTIATRGEAEDITRVQLSPVNLYEISASKGVSPAQALVNESFNFRIRVINEGDITIPAVRVTDEFEAVLDLTSVTTNRGTATMNTGAKTIDVNVGDLAAGQEVKIDVIARVNTTVTKVETFDNKAKVTFTGGEIRTNTINYRVLPGATLPGTGWDRISPAAIGLTAAIPQAEAPPLAGVSLALIGLGLLGLLLAMLLLAYGLFAWIRKPLNAGGTIRLSLGLAVVSMFLLLGGWLLAGSLPEEPAQLGLLTGAKPPLATRLAATETAAHAPAPEPFDPEAPMLPISRPTDAPAAETVEPLFEPTPTLAALPNYPVPSPTAMVSQGPNGIPPDASQVTRIVIPSIELDTIVKYVPFDGRTWLIGGLRQEVAWMGDTSWPGLGGNTGLAGHVDLADGSDGPFAALNNLKPGDEVQVFTEKNRYNYTVRARSVVDDHDLTVIAATAGPQLTLITCTGMDPALGLYLERLIVTADLAGVQPLTASGN